MFAFVWNKFQIVPQYLAQSKFGCSICSILSNILMAISHIFPIKIWMFQLWPSTKESPLLEASNYHPILPCIILAIRWLHVQSRIRGHLQTNIWLFIVISLAKSKNLAKIYGKPLAKSMNIYSYFSGKIYEQSGKNLWKTWVYLSLLYLNLPGLGPRRKMSWTLFAPRIWGNEWRVGCLMVMFHGNITRNHWIMGYPLVMSK